MRNVQKVLIGIFLSGVLLSGIGTGIVVQEFSSLGYGGRKLIGTEDLVTKEMDFTLPMDGKTVILGYHGYGRDWEGSLVEDPSVPAGVVRYEVTYNERLIEPFLYYEEYNPENLAVLRRWIPGYDARENSVVHYSGETVHHVFHIAYILLPQLSELVCGRRR